jgi:hypothetical protein
MPGDTRLPFSMLGKYEVGGQLPQRRLRHSHRPKFEPALAVECGDPLERHLERRLERYVERRLR